MRDLPAVCADIQKYWPDMPPGVRYYFNLIQAQDFINSADRVWLVNKFLEASFVWPGPLELRFELRNLL